VERLSRPPSTWSPRYAATERPRELVLFAYELGVARATGALVIEPRGASRESVEVLVGEALTTEADALGRQASSRLARLASLPGARLCFEPAVVSGALRTLPLAQWARQTLEREVDLDASQRLAHELGDVELALIPRRAPDPAHLDPTERRLVAALARPRRLPELCTVARIARYKVLAFLHFLRETGALEVRGSASSRPARPSSPPARAFAAASPPPPKVAALGVLGLPGDADAVRVKQTFRSLARAFHPDRHPGVGEERRRELELRLARLTAAYAELIAT
jgi:hypothetical protein